MLDSGTWAVTCWMPPMTSTSGSVPPEDEDPDGVGWDGNREKPEDWLAAMEAGAL